MKKSFKIISFFLLMCFPTMFFGQSIAEKTSYVIKEKLEFPFGTLVKIKFEIISGDSLELKALSGIYLLKIKEINNQNLKEPFIIEFFDESGEFPTNDLALYEKLYNKEAEAVSSDQIKKMQKDYVGKTFIALGYESGSFVGIPEKSDYVMENIQSFQLVKQDVSFHFKNYIVIDSKLSE